MACICRPPTARLEAFYCIARARNGIHNLSSKAYNVGWIKRVKLPESREITRGMPGNGELDYAFYVTCRYQPSSVPRRCRSSPSRVNGFSSEVASAGNRPSAWSLLAGYADMNATRMWGKRART
jgi:hypothetical protein